MSKDLKDKAIDIKGKKYVLVADRIVYFNENYPNGSIETEILENGDDVVIKATVYPEGQGRKFVAHSQATWGDGYINKTSALENAETSSVGRCLAMMGIGIIESIASVDEINKAQTQPEKKTSQNSLIKAKQAIEDAQTLEEYTMVANQVRKSQWLSNEDKDILLGVITDNMSKFDPITGELLV